MIFKDIEGPDKCGIGRKFTCNDGTSNVYVLALTRSCQGAEVCLINIHTGNRWSDAVKVGDHEFLTSEEWRRVCSGQPENFKEIEND